MSKSEFDDVKREVEADIESARERWARGVWLDSRVHSYVGYLLAKHDAAQRASEKPNWHDTWQGKLALTVAGSVLSGVIVSFASCRQQQQSTSSSPPTLPRQQTTEAPHN